jgi:hypothetical protein
MDQDELAPHVLLAKALRTLTDDEQAVVLQHVLPFIGLVRGPASSLTPRPTASRAALAVELAGQPPAGGDKVALLVRLPSTTHGRLKAWCDSNGHSMNVVVRGLVEQFLDANPPE